MALPGLSFGTAPIAVAEERAPTIVELKASTEWRFEVAFGQNVEVKLLSGDAEIFGTELASNYTYSFDGRKAAIFTWHGCKIEVTGDCQIDYTAEETPVMSYANTHFALEALRDSAVQTGSTGPRVLVAGPENAGKTSLVKFLAAYATRAGRRPIIANLDPKEGMLTVPGTLSAVALESIVDVEEGWGSSPMNGPSQIPVKLPLVYYYGHEDPDAQADLFKTLATRMALSTANRMEDDGEVKHTGCIIDTAGSISQGKGNYDVIQHLVAEFQVNVLIVLGSERLYSDMTRRFARAATASSPGISVIKLDKSGGCVDRDAEYMSQLRQAQIKEYFYGDARTSLSPHTQILDFNDAHIFRAAEHSDIMDSLLPGGTDYETSSKEIFEKVAPSPMMDHHILAIVQADPDDSQEHIRDASVIGFVHVAEVDEKKRKLRILAPLSGRLPRRAMLWGSWPERAADLAT